VLEWGEIIDEPVPYIFGFRISSPRGGRLADWVKVDAEDCLNLQDYGEQCLNLALAGGVLGMSRAAWEISGGFNQDLRGPGEEIDFTLSLSRKKKVPIVFCDAIHAVRIGDPSNHPSRERRTEGSNG